MNRLADSTKPDAAPNGGGRMAGEERRQQIVRVAMRLFSQRGFSGTTTKEIAREAGVSEAMVFKHFATKEELFNAILDHKACAGDMGHACAALAEARAHLDRVAATLATDEERARYRAAFNFNRDLLAAGEGRWPDPPRLL